MCDVELGNGGACIALASLATRGGEVIDVVVVATGSAGAGVAAEDPSICAARALSFVFVAMAESIVDRSVVKSPPLEGNKELYTINNNYQKRSGNSKIKCFVGEVNLHKQVVAGFSLGYDLGRSLSFEIKRVTINRHR